MHALVCWITQLPPFPFFSSVRCCHLLLKKITAQLDQSHVGHQHSPGTSVNELICSFVSISSALSLSLSVSLSLSFCIEPPRGKRKKCRICTGLNSSMKKIVAKDYLLCTFKVQGFGLMVLLQRHFDRQYKDERLLLAACFLDSLYYKSGHLSWHGIFCFNRTKKELHRKLFPSL